MEHACPSNCYRRRLRIPIGKNCTYFRLRSKGAAWLGPQTTHSHIHILRETQNVTGVRYQAHATCKKRKDYKHYTNKKKNRVGKVLSCMERGLKPKRLTSFPSSALLLPSPLRYLCLCWQSGAERLAGVRQGQWTRAGLHDSFSLQPTPHTGAVRGIHAREKSTTLQPNL